MKCLRKSALLHRKRGIWLIIIVLETVESTSGMSSRLEKWRIIRIVIGTNKIERATCTHKYHELQNKMTVIKPLSRVLDYKMLYPGSRLLMVVCPNCFSSPFKSPWILIGRATPRLTRVMIDIKIIKCLWKERYWTASSPHLDLIWSSLQSKRTNSK